MRPIVDPATTPRTVPAGAAGAAGVPVPAAAPAARAGRLATLRALRKVAKLSVVQHYFGIPLVLTLLPAASATAPRTWAVLALCLVCLVGVVATTTSLDDLTGYRNGGDALTYGEEGRGNRVKPLLHGGVSERSVRALAATCEWSALATGTAALLVSGRHTPAAVLLFVVPALLSPHYSWGLRLSYRPGGAEALVFCSTVATLLWPYALLADDGLPAPVIAEAVLLGLWFLVVLVSENRHDAAGDLAVGRRTLSALLPATAVRRLLAVLMTAAAALAAGCVARGALPMAALVLLLPVVVLHLRHLAVVRSGSDWLRGAAVSFAAFNVGFLALLATNLLHR